jgi:hypothetical protein
MSDPNLAIIQPVPVRSRILEIALSVGFSSAFSIGAMLWALSGTLAEVKEKVADHERRMQTFEAAETHDTIALASMNARADGQDTYRREIDDRLHEMDEKLDRLLAREGRNR